MMKSFPPKQVFGQCFITVIENKLTNHKMHVSLNGGVLFSLVFCPVAMKLCPFKLKK